MREGTDRSRIWGLRIAGPVVGGLIFGLLLAFVFGYLVEIVWNRTLPAVFGLGTITYWQGFGLVLLARLLFGSWGNDPVGIARGVHVHAGRQNVEDVFVGVKAGTNLGRSRKARVRYDDWWREEGKLAFESYVERKGREAGGEDAE